MSSAASSDGTPSLFCSPFSRAEIPVNSVFCAGSRSNCPICAHAQRSWLYANCATMSGRSESSCASGCDTCRHRRGLRRVLSPVQWNEHAKHGLCWNSLCRPGPVRCSVGGRLATAQPCCQDRRTCAVTETGEACGNSPAMRTSASVSYMPWRRRMSWCVIRTDTVRGAKLPSASDSSLSACCSISDALHGRCSPLQGGRPSTLHGQP